MESLFFPLLIVLIAVPMFLQARKQKKLMQEQQKLQSSLTVGDRIMTTSGLYGTVVDTADETVDLEIAPGVVTTWVRAAVREKVETEAAEATEPQTGSEGAAEDAEAQDVKDEQPQDETAEATEKQKTN